MNISKNGAEMVELEVQNGIATITINRPDKANALTDAMLVDLGAAVRQAKGAKGLTLTGTGKVFSAGADLDDVKNGLATSPNWEALSAEIANFPGLTVAVLNGTVAGGAMGMVLACDMRLAVPTAKFFYPVMKLGILPQPSDPGRLLALIGPSRAKEIILAGRKVDAATALNWGLANQVGALDELKQSITDLLQDAALHHLEALKEFF